MNTAGYKQMVGQYRELVNFICTVLKILIISHFYQTIICLSRLNFSQVTTCILSCMSCIFLGKPLQYRTI